MTFPRPHLSGSHPPLSRSLARSGGAPLVVGAVWRCPVGGWRGLAAIEVSRAARPRQPVEAVRPAGRPVPRNHRRIVDNPTNHDPGCPHDGHAMGHLRLLRHPGRLAARDRHRSRVDRPGPRCRPDGGLRPARAGGTAGDSRAALPRGPGPRPAPGVLRTRRRPARGRRRGAGGRPAVLAGVRGRPPRPGHAPPGGLEPGAADQLRPRSGRADACGGSASRSTWW